MKTSFLFLSLFILLLMPDIPAPAQVSVQISVAPPMIPVYVQPECPGDGYLWTPGYWAYGSDDYYWVPGVWMYPAQVGFLWTPGYWGYEGGYYGWNGGYWGPHIGYYGGICYGHGYDGEGYSGGRWDHGYFQYNTAVSNVRRGSVHNTYEDRTVLHGSPENRSGFNGSGGILRKPSEHERTVMNEHHVAPTSEQHSRQQSGNHAASPAPHAEPSRQHAAPVQHQQAAPQHQQAPAQHQQAVPQFQHPGPPRQPAPQQHTGPAQNHESHGGGEGHPR
ncbi:MAG: YXWGXW repeat-containing protein [Bacteroidia bacterium]